MKKLIKKHFDRRVNLLIEKYLKTNFDLHVTPEYKQIFEKGYLTALWDEATKRGDSNIIKYWKGGLKIKCYLDSFLARLIYLEDFENTEIDFINNFLKEGDIFIDIGSNIGLFSLNASVKVGPRGKIVSFEPTPVTYNRLIENINLNGFNNIKPFQIAISDKTEKKQLLISKDGYDAWNSFGMPTRGANLEKVEVVCYKIDEIDKIDSDFHKASLIKIDIEGWELNALKGGAEFFSKPDAPTLLIEFTDDNAKNAGTSCREIYLFLQQLGYQMYEYDSSNNIMIPSKLKEYYPYENLIATKNISTVMERINR